MKILASESRPAAAVSRCQSDEDRNPVRTACESTFASEHSMRCTSCWADISRLSTSAVPRRVTPTCWTMFRAKAVLCVTTWSSVTYSCEGCVTAMHRVSVTRVGSTATNVGRRGRRGVSVRISFDEMVTSSFGSA